MKTEYRVSPLTIVLLVLFFGMMIHYCSGSSETMLPGDRRILDNYTFETEEGSLVTVSDFAGKILVLEVGACTSGG